MSEQTFKGEIEKLWINEKNYVIEIKGERYSMFGSPEDGVVEGSMVSGSYVVNGKYKNIKSLVVENPYKIKQEVEEIKDSCCGAEFGMIFNQTMEFLRHGGLKPDFQEFEGVFNEVFNKLYDVMKKKRNEFDIR